MSPTCLVIENDPADDPGRLGEWLTEAGLSLRVLRPHAGDELPDTVDGLAALVVLGGSQHVTGGDVTGGGPGGPGGLGSAWFDRLESLLRRVVKAEVPTLAICLGAQLLADAHAGLVEPSPGGPEIGPGLVAKRDVADRDVLFGPLPMLPDVIQWHWDEVTELPLAATLLAAGSATPVQAFRLGRAAWGVQFHLECDPAMVARWAAADAAALRELGLDPDQVVAAAEAVDDDLFEAWHPVAARFAALARGDLALPAAPSRQLPFLGATPPPGP